MGNILIILCDTPFQSDRVDHALKIADVALKRNHEVSIFLFMDGIYNMLNTQDGSPFKIITTSQRLSELMVKGAKIFCCKLCKILRGLEDSLIPSGVQVTGISELNDLIADSDAVISFMGG
jgi:sulfur relay (sulfurtransferase) complex TusBCD TusD component (DsrE family)